MTSRSRLNVDRFDAKLDQVLTMTVLPLRVILAPLFLENDDLVAAGLAEDLRHHGRARHSGSTDLRLIAADHEHFAERDFVLLRAAENVTLHAQKLAFGNTI